MMKKIMSILSLAVLALPSVAFADDAGSSHGLISVGAGIAVGLAGMGGGLGQGKLVASALESIGRNPASSGKLFLPMILGLAFVEAIVILSFIIAIFLQG